MGSWARIGEGQVPDAPIARPDGVSVRSSGIVRVEPTAADVHVLGPRGPGIRILENPDDPGLPRDRMTVPISPVAEPVDTVLYESPQDPGRLLYLPRYRIADGPPLRVHLAQGATDWTLAVDLERYRAPEVEATGAGAIELPHALGVMVRFSIVSGGTAVGVRELWLDEQRDTPTGVRAVRRRSDSATRDLVHLAMTDQVYGAELVVRRGATVAVPVTRTGGAIVSSGQTVLRGTWTFDFDLGAEGPFDGADVWWEQMTATARQMAVQGVARIAHLGPVDFEALDVGALRGLAYDSTPIPGHVDGPNALTPGAVFAVRTTGGNLAKVQVLAYDYNLTLRWVTYSPSLAPPTGAPPVSTGQGVLRGTYTFDLDTGTEGASSGADIWWQQMTATERQMTPYGGATIAYLGQVDFDALGPGALATAAYSNGSIRADVHGPNHLTPGAVFAVRTTNGNHAKVQVLAYGYNLAIRWATYPPGAGQPPPPSTFRVVSFSDDTAVPPRPFVFPAGSPVFAGLGTASGGGGLRRQDVRYAGRQHSYYQDTAMPWVFSYLPDHLRIARRRAGTRHVPALSVQLTATEDAVEAATVTFAYTAVPYVDDDRLEAAAEALRPLLPASLPAGVTGPVLQALQVPTDALTYSLSLPRADGTTGAVVRDRAIVDLRSGIADVLTISMADFRPVFQALFAGTELFRGDVAVALGNLGTEHVGLVGQLAETAGAPVVDGLSTPTGPDSVRLNLGNRIESPVTVNALDVRLTRGAAVVPGSVTKVAPPLPVTLSPDDPLVVDVTAAGPLPGTAPIDALLDLDEVVVAPSAEAVWTAILSAAAPAVYRYTVVLDVYASAFVGPPERPADTVLELNIDFRAGTNVTVQVSPGQLAPGAHKVSTSVALAMPIVNWLLNVEHLNRYGYRITVVRPSGIVTGPWTSRQSAILPIQSVPLVGAQALTGGLAGGAGAPR